MAAKSKQVLRQAMEYEKPLRLRRRGEPSHRPFSLASRFVGDFGSVVRIDVVDVLHRGHDRTMSRIITSQFVGHQPSGFPALAFDQATKKPFSCMLIAAVLHEDINDIAVLIDCTPEILPLALNRDKEFVDMPGVA
jgi:hypothetical protein